MIRLKTEVNCRREHGAPGGDHLLYVERELAEALALIRLASPPVGQEEADADHVALEVLCRVFDDGADDGFGEWLAFDKSRFLHWSRALGAFIRQRLGETLDLAPMDTPHTGTEPTEGS